MSLIKDMILDVKKSIQDDKEEKFKAETSKYMQKVEMNIGILKFGIEDFKLHKKQLSHSLSADFITDINSLKQNYQLFLDDLKYTEYLYNNTYYKNVKADLKPKIEYMHKKKKEYRAEFESIYRNFKSISKGVKFPNRNEILGLMRDSFDFDGSKYNQEVISKTMLWHTI